MSDLAYMTASEAIERFTARTLSPVELMEAVIARAEAVEPTVNALCFRCNDEALAAAHAAEDRYMGKGEAPRPLEGIPTAIKDEMPIAGQPWTMGSLIFKDLVAEESSPLAQRIIDSGAIVHARTATPEFSCAGFTKSRIHGVTRNPWNPEFAVGGSSGGSGASLASGTSTLAGGSDIGGSIRIPAGFNGVVGFKAPHGRVPVEPPFNLDRYCHNGGLARTVEDMRLFENVLAGPHPMDHTSLRPKLEIPADVAGIEGMRIALCPDLGCFPLDPEVDRNTRDAAQALRDAGAIIEEVSLDLKHADIERAAAIHFAAIFGAWIGGMVDEHREIMTDHAIAFAEHMRRLAGDELPVYEGLELEAAIWNPLAAVLETHEALLCATNGTRGLVADDEYADHGLTVGGRKLPFYFEAILTPVFNIASACPVLNVPSGFADNNVPTGLQIVGRTFDDVTTFRIGAALERMRPWLDAPERRPLQGAV